MSANRTSLGCVLTALLIAGTASAQTASAQTVPPGNPWSRGTTLSAFAGIASADSDAGLLAGGAIGWEITPRVAVEGRGAWLSRPRDAEGFAADLRALVNLAATRPAVPFVGAGVGLYHASFDPSLGPLPDFYEQRVPGSGPTTGRATFTDPSFVVSAGVALFVSRQVAIRPEVEATFVRANGQTYTVTGAAVQITYHFELRDQPAPSRTP